MRVWCAHNVRNLRAGAAVFDLQFHGQECTLPSWDFCHQTALLVDAGIDILYRLTGLVHDGT